MLFCGGRLFYSIFNSRFVGTAIKWTSVRLFVYCRAGEVEVVFLDTQELILDFGCFGLLRIRASIYSHMVVSIWSKFIERTY